MPIRRAAKIPEAILHLQQQLDLWRGGAKGTGQVARVVLAVCCGIGETIRSIPNGAAAVTGLYEAEATAERHRRRKFSTVGVCGTVWPQLAETGGCVIELESAQGAKMRVLWKSNVPPDWTNLLRCWREGAR